MISIRDSYRVPGHIRVTWWLIAINVLSFLASSGIGHTFNQLVFMGGIIPAEYHFPEVMEQMAPGVQSLRLHPLIPLIWYQFLHGSWLHLISNCLAIMIFGPNLEAYMGRRRFLLFYLTCGAAGGMMQVLFLLKSTTPIIGASGAVAGLMGAYLMVYPANYIRITLGSIQSSTYRDVMIPLKVIIAFWALSQVLDAIVPSVEPSNQVAYLVHLGGFIAGYLLAKGRGGLGNARRNFKVFMGGKAHGGGSH